MSVSLFLSGCHPAANIQAKFRYISNRFARRALWMSMWWEPCSRPIQLNKIYIVFSQAVTHPGTNTTRRCLTSCQWEIEIQTLIAPVGAFRNCLRQLCFKSKWRGIGYSFQLAITAPLYSITGYCIATAQSYSKLNDDLIYWDFTIQFLLQNFLSIPTRGWVFFYLITKVCCNSTEENLLRVKRA